MFQGWREEKLNKNFVFANSIEKKNEKRCCEFESKGRREVSVSVASSCGCARVGRESRSHLERRIFSHMAQASSEIFSRAINGFDSITRLIRLSADYLQFARIARKCHASVWVSHDSVVALRGPKVVDFHLRMRICYKISSHNRRTRLRVQGSCAERRVFVVSYTTNIHNTFHTYSSRSPRKIFSETRRRRGEEKKNTQIFYNSCAVSEQESYINF